MEEIKPKKVDKRKKPTEDWLRVAVDQRLKRDLKLLCSIENMTLTNKVVQLIIDEVARNREAINEIRIQQIQCGR